MGSLPPQLVAQVQQLTVPQLEDLGEALLDFRGLADLEGWLRENRGLSLDDKLTRSNTDWMKIHTLVSSAVVV